MSFKPANIQQYFSRVRQNITSVFARKKSSIVPESNETISSPKPSQKRFPIWAIALLVVLLLVITSVSVVGVHAYGVAMVLKGQAQEAAAEGQALKAGLKNQNLAEMKAAHTRLVEKVSTMESTYNQLAYLQYFPFGKRYYEDGLAGIATGKAGLSALDKTIVAIEPYADIVGFAGDQVFEGGPTENRIKAVLQTLEKIAPVLDEIKNELIVAEEAFSEINPEHYPETLQGREIRAQIIEAQELLGLATESLDQYRPFIEQLPAMAGATGERKKYLVLFQNDNELRPTGGFLTAYAVIFVEDGVITPEKSDDIYELDKKFTQRIPIPESLGRYLTTERYWNLRDMNISPDFKTSMDTFFEYYENIPGEPENIDGIVAVDTHVLNDLISVVGPVEVPGYGTFTSENDPRCDCPQIIYALSEIITKPTPYIREDRKGILAPLMQGILQKVYSAPSTYMQPMFELALNKIEGRHIQAYFVDETFQTAAENIEIAGRMEPPTATEDFIGVVNANLGGAKSNLFVTSEMEQIVSAPESGSITKEVTITYRNSRKGDNCNLEAGLLCLNSTLRDWTRIYVPEGSELVDAQGFTEELTTYNEDGFTVFDGYFTLEPLGQAKLKLTYTVPYDDQENYGVTIWKQGGIDPVPQLMEVTGGQEEIVVDKDTVYRTKF